MAAATLYDFSAKVNDLALLFPSHWSFAVHKCCVYWLGRCDAVILCLDSLQPGLRLLCMLRCHPHVDPRLLSV